MEIRDMTALEVGEAIRRGEISIREALEAAWEAVAEREDRLHCFITLDRDGAFSRADELQKEIMRGEIRSPLMGVPFAVKDNLCTKGMRTTCGSGILEHFTPAYQATVVERLERAGAILIGKTNMDEFAMGSTTETSFFGPTRNPWEESHSPGGSSGGSAAAVAAGECFFTLGSDTGGSIRQPASHCGVAGLKPTYGLVSRFGLVAYASSMDQVGPITKDFKDCRAVLSLIAGKDDRDGTSWKGVIPPAKARTGDMTGLRVGILTGLLGNGTDAEVAKTVWNAADYLRGRGAFVEECHVDGLDWIVPTYYIVATAEASSNLSRYDGVKYGHRAQAEGLEEMYRKTRSEGFGDEVKKRILLGTFVLSEGFYDAYYLRALKVRRLIRDAFDRAFGSFDVLLCPVAPTAAMKLGEGLADPLRTYMADIDTAFANLCGLPAISVPFGENASGLPIGVQVVADRFGEDLLLWVGEELERGSIRRR